MYRKVKFWSITGVTGMGVATLALALYAIFLQITNNFHTVIPGELYRSAQPTSTKIRAYQQDYNIKTIINLRGPNQNRQWYIDEVAESGKLNIAHIDFDMSAGRELTEADAQRLIAIFREVQKPILLHCQGGADRSGLASALYLAAVAKSGEESAEKQISLRYGHLSVPGTAAYPIDCSWEKMEPYLGFQDS